MCGIAGLIAPGGMPRAELCAAIQPMSEALRHRGPDDSGVWIDEPAGVALGFRRLAIVDLSDAGHQPMISRDGRFTLIFNGEIYNHQQLRALVAADGGQQAWT